MKKFILKSSLFLALIVTLYLGYITVFRNYIDYFYPKFISPSQYSLIIGDSRAKGGIVPQVLDSVLEGENFVTPTYNYSFTIAQSAYGPKYLESIKRKLNTTLDSQLFILQVSPWMLSNRNPVDSIETDNFLINRPPHNMKNVSMNPNIEYIIKNQSYFNYKGIFRKQSICFDDGHSIYDVDPNEEVFNSWKKKQLNMFINWSNEWIPSEFRIKYLDSTIQYLNRYGKVFLVRMPFNTEFLELENTYWPDFDFEMEKLSSKTESKYLNYSQESHWKTFDGHHLHYTEAPRFSNKLGLDILKTTKKIELF